MSPDLEDVAIPVASLPRAPHGEQVRVEPSPRWVRGVFAGERIVDSRRALLLFEAGRLPVYYFPLEDVRTELLSPSQRRETSPVKGEARFESLTVGDRDVLPDVAWRYEHPPEGCPDISGYVAFYWNAMDSWWEEDDQVFVHARDPYKRVDVVRSSRHVHVEVAGQAVADSHRPLLLFETALPTRYYLPRADVRLDLLVPSDTRTACPYKGTAQYYSLRLGHEVHEDLAWTYVAPIPECTKIEQAICFYNERVDLWVDGERQLRPQSPWS